MKKKIGIILPFQNGDLMQGASVLKYREELWPGCDLVWFCNDTHSDLLRYHNIEIRPFPHGWGILEDDINGVYAERVKKDKEEGRLEWQDWTTLVNSGNRLIQELKYKFSAISDLHDAYFAATWMVPLLSRVDVEYANVSKKVFGVPDNYPWHPYLLFSDEERERVSDFMNALPRRKNLLIETFAGSGQSAMNEQMIKYTIAMCRSFFGGCNFLFASHKFLNGKEEFPKWLQEEEGFVHMAEFKPRLFGLIINFCDLMISVSSGLTVAASCWDAKKVATIQFCGSSVCGTKSISNGRFEAVYHERNHVAEAEYYVKLQNILSSI